MSSEAQDRVSDDVAQGMRNPRSPERTRRDPRISEDNRNHPNDDSQSDWILLVPQREDCARTDRAHDDARAIQFSGEWKTGSRSDAVKCAEHQTPVHDLLVHIADEIAGHLWEVRVKAERPARRGADAYRNYEQDRRGDKARADDPMPGSP